ncbi:unnamed protein product [Strongylus vulgaris]|uniref:Uncharacterized protein n=1 Tax=Strongylus vulgaris TaxID=40348 RepID=A0A3P7K3M4_STRVU|nr:unnamed protein product [Strongylus vulgaris]
MPLLRRPLLTLSRVKHLLSFSRCVKHSVAVQIGDGEPLTFTTGEFMKLTSANLLFLPGSCTIYDNDSFCICLLAKVRFKASSSKLSSYIKHLALDFWRDCPAKTKLTCFEPNHEFWRVCLGHMARFASGAVVASVGDSAVKLLRDSQVLSTCVFRQSSSEGQGQDFVPLLVDFKQSAAAVGKIPTNYFRRELGQSDADILASRVIDRSLRPLFPPGWTNETQVNDSPHLFTATEYSIVVKPLAIDDEGDVVSLGLNAAASALHASAVPWLGPAAAVRIALVGDKVTGRLQLILNPTRSVIKESRLDLLLTGCNDKRTVMIEMDGDQLPVERIEEAVDEGLNATSKLISAMDELRALGGKEKAAVRVLGNLGSWSRYCASSLLQFSEPTFPEELQDEVRALCEERLYYIFTDPSHDKISRDEAIREVGKDVVASIKDGDPPVIQSIFRYFTKKVLRSVLFLFPMLGFRRSRFILSFFSLRNKTFYL